MRTLSKALLWSYFFITILYAKDGLSLGNEVKDYDKIFDRIAERRSGADIIAIEKLENPFVVVSSDTNSSEGNEVVQPLVYTLEATFDQKAKINGMWYKKNDTVGSFKLIKIIHDRVILQNEIEKKELLLRTKDESNIKLFSK